MLILFNGQCLCMWQYYLSDLHFSRFPVLRLPYEDVIGLGGNPGSVGSSARKCRGQGSKVSQLVQFHLIYMHS